MGIKFDDEHFYVQHGSYIQKEFFINKRQIITELYNRHEQERYRDFNKFYLRDSNIVIFVYSITSRYSFEDLNSFIKMAEESNRNNFKGVIIGKKIDLYDNEEVSEKEAKDFAQNHNYEFYLTSAKRFPIETKNIIEKIIKDYIVNLTYEN